MKRRTNRAGAGMICADPPVPGANLDRRPPRVEEDEGHSDRLVGLGMMDPTAFADDIASEMRVYYEARRESWWARKLHAFRYGARPNAHADNLMLGLLFIAERRLREKVNRS
jgi:hypothetical protein